MNQANTLEINCDLGEGVAWENEIFPWIDRASIACGGHIGDEESIATSLAFCKKFGIKAGAHPSYPDRENFGRISLSITDEELIFSLGDQIQLFSKLAKQNQVPLEHIKFHGALYNDAAKYHVLAKLLIQFIHEEYPGTPLLVPPHSELEKEALRLQHPFLLEVFGDRRYTDDYQLLGRSKEGALLTDFSAVESQLEGILTRNVLISESGKELPIKAETLCFHGDNPEILQLLLPLRKKYWQ
ncbi:LamB/YcsF family protein [Algoriphagus taiwanensis]|uniref:5-oxoprolinase subunit PxpA n=1 Tax=Algoriphagus taiwanensis TaxID=1445656 RepID=A0ABQ6Q5E3_9BACT|nr:5-oxoprolinase subunit PxpA [Algoriphagus taiwanensis]